MLDNPPGQVPNRSVSAADFRRVAGCFATGVVVVTTRLDDADHAMTANSFTSLSLDPLLVLVCVDRATRFHEAITSAPDWGLSILDAAAQPTAAWLATRGRPLADQLARTPHTRGPHTGAALLTTALATLECRTAAVHPGGDHSIIVGSVLAATLAPEPPDPLVFYRGAYHQLGRPLQ